MIYWKLAGLLILVVLVASCSGEDKGDNLLRLPGEELTESELRERWRGQMSQAPAAAAVICSAITDIDVDAVLSFFEVDVSSRDLTDSQLADVRRAAEILQEECADAPASLSRGRAHSSSGVEGRL